MTVDGIRVCGFLEGLERSMLEVCIALLAVVTIHLPPRDRGVATKAPVKERPAKSTRLAKETFIIQTSTL